VSVGVDSAFDPGVQAIIGTATVGLGALVAYLGLEVSVRAAVALTVLTVPIVVLITIAAAFDTGLAIGDQLSLQGASASGIFQGVAAGAVFLVAFESSAALAAETREPIRNVPLAIMSVPVVLGGAYLLVALLQVPGLTAASDALASGASPAAALAREAGLGDTVAEATDLVLAIANVASVIGFLTYGSRFLATLATDRLLPEVGAQVHPRYRSPSIAISAWPALRSRRWWGSSGSTRMKSSPRHFLRSQR
jgi:amino acid transporter